MPRWWHGQDFHNLYSAYIKHASHYKRLTILSISTPRRVVVLSTLSYVKVKNCTLLPRFPGHSVATRKKRWNVNSTARWIWQKYAMRHCIAVGCSYDSKKDKDLLFLQLPKVKCTLKRWLNYIRRERLNVDPTVDNWHHVLCSIAFYGWMPILPIQTFEKHLPSLFVNYNFKQSIRRKKNEILTSG